MHVQQVLLRQFDVPQNVLGYIFFAEIMEKTPHI